MTKRMKIFLLSGLGLLLLASTGALAVQFFAARAASRERPEPLPVYSDAIAAATPESAPEEEASFVLRDFNGYIAVFRLPETDRPDVITGIDTRTLRRADYLELQTGIRVEGWENLQSALEDFGP